MIQPVKNMLAVLLAAGLALASGWLSLQLYFMLSASADLPNSPALTGGEANLHPLAAAEAGEAAVPAADEPESVGPAVAERPPSAMLDAPVVLQRPELYNGCEITTLTMLLNYLGIGKTKMELMKELRYDPAPLVYNRDGSIRSWGDPNVGFVGDITGKQKGYGVYHGPLFDLLAAYVPTAVDLTGGDFAELERRVAAGAPVIVWSTVSYRAPADHQWLEWESAGGTVRATFQEHTVLMVGYDETSVYLNDPLKTQKNIRVDKQTFIESWEALGKQAISYDPAGEER